jgi:UDP-N-acetylmuramoyl-L-alanyl-D-glutamate--2,6-diaminopimelate ligase
MIYHFGAERYTDDTREVGDGVQLVRTHQNAPFVGDAPAITPKELIERYGLDSVKVVGVTGTNGKTTTTAAIYSFLSDLGHTAALQGTRGFYVADALIAPKSHTTPPILQTLHHIYRAKELGVEYFVMEVSSHAIHQRRIEGLDFALKVLTNITQDHLDYHKSLEEYTAVKNSFFADDSPKLINKEEHKARFNPKNARTYAIEELATYQVLAYSLEGGISALLRFGSEQTDFHSPLLGLFNLYNLTAAFGAVHMLTGAPLDAISEVVPHFGGVRGRMEVVSQKPLVVVDFAHTPDGMQKVFESFGGRKLVALFGAGGDRDRSKRPLMGAAAARYCSRIYLTSDNPRSEDPAAIIADIRSGIKSGVEVIGESDRKKAIERALSELAEDEILLVLGKGDEEYIEAGGERIPHNDADYIAALLKK